MLQVRAKRAELTEPASKPPARSMSLKRLVVATSVATVLTVAAVLTVLAYVGMRMADGPSTETSQSEVSAVEPVVSATAAAASPTITAPTAVTRPAVGVPSEAPSQAVNDVLASNQHVVAAGETVETIADQYNVAADDLRAANQLTDADVLSVGMTLVIPVAAPTSTESSGPAADAVPEIAHVATGGQRGFHCSRRIRDCERAAGSSSQYRPLPQRSPLHLSMLNPLRQPRLATRPGLQSHRQRRRIESRRPHSRLANR